MKKIDFCLQRKYRYQHVCFRTL